MQARIWRAALFSCSIKLILDRRVCGCLCSSFFLSLLPWLIKSPLFDKLLLLDYSFDYMHRLIWLFYELGAKTECLLSFISYWRLFCNVPQWLVCVAVGEVSDFPSDCGSELGFDESGFGPRTVPCMSLGPLVLFSCFCLSVLGLHPFTF